MILAISRLSIWLKWKTPLRIFSHGGEPDVRTLRHILSAGQIRKKVARVGERGKRCIQDLGGEN
jgi:hypothetical protein